MTAVARGLRRDATFPERLLWGKLRNRNLPEAKFRRQYSIDHYVVDFCCPECRLVIELDGHSHDTTADADLRREAFLRRKGYEIVRFSNDDVLKNMGAVLETIENAVAALRGRGAS